MWNLPAPLLAPSHTQHHCSQLLRTHSDFVVCIVELSEMVINNYVPNLLSHLGAAKLEYDNTCFVPFARNIFEEERVP